MRRHPRGRWSNSVDRDHRQRRADRIHGAEAGVGPRPRAGDLAAHRTRPPAQGLRAAVSHRRPRDGQGGRCRHPAVRSRRADLVTRGGGCIENRSGLVAAHVRGSRNDRGRVRGGGSSHGFGGRHARRGRRWRPVCERRWCGCCQPGVDGSVARNVGCRLRGNRPTAVRAAWPRPRVLPRGAGAVAHDVGDALRCREPALVPRHARTGRGVRRARERHGSMSRPEATAWCSSPISPANAARIPTRWRVALSSG